jgi:ferredoxin
MNCRPVCDDQLIAYRKEPSAAGEAPLPDLSRREFTLSLAAGLSVVPMMRLDGSLATNWDPAVIRPPGSLPEDHFLRRCLKCGQCMRICPTNVIQPAGLTRGVENLWTPVLNFRIGSSGCQLNCIACGHVCPTGAILPLNLDRKLGRGSYEAQGPIRIGTAFVDHGRCLPWAMDRPCIVCQENCPVSPKAIQIVPVFSPVKGLPQLTVATAAATAVAVRGGTLPNNRFATGDYYCRFGVGDNAPMIAIAGNAETSLTLRSPVIDGIVRPGDVLTIMIRLQRPQVDPAACIGCGTCEHECPVLGLRAIRVSAENQTREKDHALLA